MKIVTNVADEAATAEVSPDRVSSIIPTVELDGRPFEHAINVNLILPTAGHGAHAVSTRGSSWPGSTPTRTTSTASPCDTERLAGHHDHGNAYYDVRQALVELGLHDEDLRRHGIRISRWACSFPMEPRVVRDFAQGLEEILVVEEKRAFHRDVRQGHPLRHGRTGPRIVGKRDEEDRLLVPSSASSIRYHRHGHREAHRPQAPGGTRSRRGSATSTS